MLWAQGVNKRMGTFWFCPLLVIASIWRSPKPLPAIATLEQLLLKTICQVRWCEAASRHIFYTSQICVSHLLSLLSCPNCTILLCVCVCVQVRHLEVFSCSSTKGGDVCALPEKKRFQYVSLIFYLTNCKADYCLICRYGCQWASSQANCINITHIIAQHLCRPMLHLKKLKTQQKMQLTFRCAC